MTRNLAISLGLILWIVTGTMAQDTIRPFYGGEERLQEYPRENTGKPRIKNAWLPNGQQIIFEGNGYREYEMWGEIRRYYFRDGISQGLVLFMDTTKTRLNKLGYFNGDKIDGTWIEFYDNGQISSTVSYENGRVISPMTLYHKNARLKSTYTVNDKLEIIGDYKEYSESGNLKLSGQYDFILCEALLDSSDYEFQKSIDRIRPRAVPVGEWIEYYESGQVMRKSYYDNYCTFTMQVDTVSKGTWTSWLLTNECPTGVWTEYDEEGKVISSRKFQACLEVRDKKKRK